MSQIRAHALVAALMTMIVAACSSRSGGASAETLPPLPTAAEPQTVTTAPLASVDPAAVAGYVGGCLDETQSVTPEFFTEARDLLADAIFDLTPLADVPSFEAQPALDAQPPMAVSIRSFDDNSFESSNDIVTATIPGVPRLDAEPSIDEFPQTLSEELADWRPDAMERAQAFDAAEAVAQSSGSALRSASYGNVRGTDLGGCLSAHLELSRSYPNAQVVLVIASDMQAVGVQQVLDGRFADDTRVEAHIVQYCTEAQRCEDIQSEWSGSLEDTWGFDDVVWSRTEVADSAVSQALAELRAAT